MIKLKINGVGYNIPPVSKLTFDEFNKIRIKGDNNNVIDYISAYTQTPKDDLMRAQMKVASPAALHQSIFDIDEDKELKERKLVLKYDGTFYELDHLAINTFGKSYHFELYRQQYAQDKINNYELCLYALAIALSDVVDKDIEVIYRELKHYHWTQVLPHSFFLGKMFCGSMINSFLLSMRCISALKTTRLKTLISRKELERLEKI